MKCQALFSLKNNYFRPSSEMLGASHDYPQHIFSWKSVKNINTFWLKKKTKKNEKKTTTYLIFLAFL